MLESRTYDRAEDPDFGADPVAVVVATGTHDVSRLVALFCGGMHLTEHMVLGDQLRRQARRKNGGRAALKLLADHGGRDFTDDKVGHVKVEFQGPDGTRPYFVCQKCGLPVVEIKAGRDMPLLLSHVDVHKCPPPEDEEEPEGQE
jgi:hypothetical protein